MQHRAHQLVLAPQVKHNRRDVQQDQRQQQPFADIETNQQMTVGKINLAPYPAKNFCEWLQEQAKVQRSRKDS